MTLNFKMTAAEIDAALPTLQSDIATITGRVQAMACSILAAWHKSGDKDTAVRQTNALIVALGNGMRKSSMQTWLMLHAPLTINKETKLMVFDITGPVKGYKQIDEAANAANPWHEAAKNKDAEPIGDWTKMLKGLIAKAENDLVKFPETSKVNRAELAAIKGLLVPKQVELEDEPAAQADELEIN